MSFSGPSHLHLPLAMAGSYMIGELYQAIAMTNTLPSLILVIREIADWIFYRLAITLFRPFHDRCRAQIYAATNLTVNIATLGVFLRLQLIGKIGTQICIGIMTIEMVCKCLDFSKYRVHPINQD